MPEAENYVQGIHSSCDELYVIIHTIANAKHEDEILHNITLIDDHLNNIKDMSNFLRTVLADKDVRLANMNKNFEQLELDFDDYIDDI